MRRRGGEHRVAEALTVWWCLVGSLVVIAASLVVELVRSMK